jgi:hypothetical protein
MCSRVRALLVAGLLAISGSQSAFAQDAATDALHDFLWFINGIKNAIVDWLIRHAVLVGTVVWVVIAILIISFIWDLAKSAYFAVAAKWHGWSEEEKFKRAVARARPKMEREGAREDRRRARDEIAASDYGRRRLGIMIATYAFAPLAFQVAPHWWQAALVTVMAFVGLTMAVGLSWRW